MPVHTYGVHEGVVYLDMRLVQGRSLAAARAEGLDAGRVSAVVNQLNAAVGAIRASGLGDRP